MKIKKMLGFLLAAVIMLPMMTSCSGESDSDSPFFGSLPKVLEEYRAASEKLQEESKNIQTEEEKAEYLKKTEKLMNKWSEKVEKSARKLDGKPIEFAEGQFDITQSVSLQFKSISNKTYMYVDFDINGSAETSEEIILDKPLYMPSANVYFIGYDSEGQRQFSASVGSVEVQKQGGKSVVPKGTPVKFNTFLFGKYGLDKYVNTQVLKLEFEN